MKTECYCDYEPADVYKTKRRMARTAHRCDECNKEISPGEIYEHAAMSYDGYWSTYRTCVHCLSIRDLMEASCCCFCWAHSNMLDDVKEELDHNGHKMPGLMMAIGRLVIEAKRKR